jgi:hypothetical protein
MRTTGPAHFENQVLTFVALPQPVESTTTSAGVFLQLNWKMGPYSVLDVH